jgi:Ni/Fe-hydrogenase subunit HybB-like protein
MTKALVTAVGVFVVVLAGLMLAEKLIHRLTHNHDRNYRWGVWLFALLAAVYAYLTSLGRA